MDDDWGYPYFRKPPHEQRNKETAAGPLSVELQSLKVMQVRFSWGFVLGHG